MSTAGLLVLLAGFYAVHRALSQLAVRVEALHDRLDDLEERIFPPPPDNYTVDDEDEVEVDDELAVTAADP